MNKVYTVAKFNLEKKVGEINRDGETIVSVVFDPVANKFVIFTIKKSVQTLS